LNDVSISVKLKGVKHVGAIGNLSQNSKLDLTKILIRVSGAFENFDCEVLVALSEHEYVRKV
jgi:hypothetical protein